MVKKSDLKAIFFVLFLLLAFYFVSDYVNLSKEGLRVFINSFGVLAPIAHILIYSLGIVFLLPGTVFSALGAVVFGTFKGYLLNLFSAMLGASASFYLARFLGKDFVDKIVKGKLAKYNAYLEKEGFASVFYLRLIFAPFSLLNFAAGLTKIKFKDFFWGTFLGILPGTFIITFFFDSLTDIRKFSDIFSGDVLFSILLFGFSFFIPVIVKKFNKNN